MTTPATSSGLLHRLPVSRSVLIGVGIAAVAYAVAIVGALLFRTDEGLDSINGFVESISGSSGGGLSDLLGFTYAYAVGLASAVNPCGFAMLPAYLGLYVSGGNQERDRRQPLLLIARALMVGLSVSLGFVLLFGVVGLILGLGAQAVIEALPWIGLAIGVLLVAGGAFIAAGGKIYTSLAQRAANKIGNPDQMNIPSYVLFGISYGLASLSCTLPLFLAAVGFVAGQSSGWLDTAINLLFYAAGMGTVILALTLGMAVARTVLVRWLRKAMPYVGIAGAWLMVVAGTYIVYYWLTIGDLFQ